MALYANPCSSVVLLTSDSNPVATLLQLRSECKGQMASLLAFPAHMQHVDCLSHPTGSQFWAEKEHQIPSCLIQEVFASESSVVVRTIQFLLTSSCSSLKFQANIGRV